MRRSNIFGLFFFTSFFGLFIVPAAAQGYEEQWKKINALVQKSRPASALEEVKKIYEQAKQDKQDVQVVKALLYMNNLQSENRENSELLSIGNLEVEIINANEPTRSILQNILAEAYRNYLVRIRWKLYNRTKTDNYKSYDIDTWGLDDFHQKISELFNASLQNEQLLQSVTLDQFDPLLIKGNARILRPAIYDLLANRAFDYFKNDERDITKPAYRFDLDQASAFWPAEKFVSPFGNTKDSLTFQHPALLILRKLMAFHLNDDNPAALIDADINRIKFVWDHSTHPAKDQLYLDALNRLVTEYGDHPAVMQAHYLVATYYQKKGNSWRPFGDTAYRYDKVRAKEICEKVIKQTRESEGKTNCENLLTTLMLQDIDFSIEDVNIPFQPFRVLIKYSNTPDIWLRVVKYQDAVERIQDEEEYIKAIVSLPAIKEWQQALASTEDLQHHRAEIKIESLPPGKYMLLAATDKNFKDKNTTVTLHTFYVSNISFVKRGLDMFVLNRESGQPLVNAYVQVWERGYNNSGAYVNEKGYLFNTDNNGYFKVRFRAEENKRTSSPAYDITFKDDRLFMVDDPERSYYSSYRYRNPLPYRPAALNEKSNVFLFTDRSIYRPGQVVYFKGIVLMKDSTGRSGSVQKNYSLTLDLKNTSRQNITSLVVTTNEFGSFNGTFHLPAHGLNGDYSIYISDDLGSIHFRVEEYKRPKFFVEYETVKGAYKLYDTIKVTGIAKAYAGNAIDGATVKYRVVRNVHYLYDWYFWYRPRPWSNEARVAHGETTTDNDGKFTIVFKAFPDSTLDRNTEPAFTYTVYADITDINGETRTEEKSVTAGYKPMVIFSKLPGKMPVDSLYDLQIRTENLNEGFEPALMNVSIVKLKDENRLIRDRLWDRPDQFTMNKEEYIKNFPYDEFDTESNPKLRSPEKTIHEQKDSSAENGKWILRQFAGKAEPGFYMITIRTTDKEGNETRLMKFLELYDHKSNRLSNPGYVHTEAPREIKPGETTTATFGTSAEKVFLIQQTSKGNAYLKPEIQTYSFFQINNEKKSISLSATENDRGGFGIEWMFVKHNRLHQHGEAITVPWSNKELNIEYITYRDKTQPGSKETWKLRITGHKNEKVAAELLASMYDESLDQLYHHEWYKPFPWARYYRNGYWDAGNNFTKSDAITLVKPEPVYRTFDKVYDALISNYLSLIPKRKSGKGRTEPLTWMNPLDYAYSETRNPRLMRLPKPVLPDSDGDGVTDQFDIEQTPAGCPVDERGVQLDSDKDGIPDCKDPDAEKAGTPEVKTRTNFNETAFFLPELYTDSSGTVEFSFTMPESLTKWKFQALAHSKDLSFGYTKRALVTQKKLMVQPNMPRFLRENDKIALSSKIVNISEKQLKGNAFLQLIDAETGRSLDTLLKNKTPRLPVSIDAGKSIVVKFPVEIPQSFNGMLTWRILCSTSSGPGETLSDGEENIIPVLPGRILVMETLPLTMRGSGTKKFTFNKLLGSNASSTLQHYSITTEYTSNPAWYAVQALPYLMEYPYECAEQTWNRYYANALATHIINSSPLLKNVFEKWKSDTAALKSVLQKNEELQSIILEETPWLRQAKNDQQRKKDLALLFDLLKMNEELTRNYEKLSEKQKSNGAFAWFTGGPDDLYITQYILTGIGHLKKINALGESQSQKLDKIIAKAMPYLDKKIREKFSGIKKDNEKADYIPGYLDLQYLYMRSFFSGIEQGNDVQAVYNYFMERASKTWQGFNKYSQGMIALVLSRNGNSKTAADILISLKETAIKNEELGMYWSQTPAGKDQSAAGGWFWYQAPIETQALLIETFQEVGKDTKTVDDLRTWLLKNKQTNNWKTTKATAEACYALLLQGTEWLSNEPTVEMKLGNTTVSSANNKQEAGTGYFKTVIEGKKVNPQMGNIAVTVSSPATNVSASWGGVYWQYFEDLDKITTASTPLKLVKKLFVEKNTDRGPVITPVNDGDVLKVGDKIKVRVELRVDRDMEYVHMKDMRASALEPVNVLSSYKYQGGLGYYESTKDASTNFFFSYLRKGTYVFEYPLFVTHAGNFSNGVTTIQCMYAPEFTSHSEGVRIKVE
jgi:hypothetical protein